MAKTSALQHGAIVLLISVVLPFLAASPAEAADVDVFAGAQIACPASRPCHPIILEIDGVTGDFLVRKGPAVSCRGTTSAEALTFSARCDPNQHNFFGGIIVGERVDGDLDFVLWKRYQRTPVSPVKYMVVRAILSPVA